MNAAGRPRVVEIGNVHVFGSYADADVTTLWTNSKRLTWGPPSFQHFSLRRFFDLRRRMRNGDVDLLVVFPPRYAPWGIRSLFNALRDDPLHAPAALLRSLGVWFVRFLPRNVPLAVVDIDDSFALPRHSFFLVDRATLVFKRELPIDGWQMFFGSAHSDLPTTRVRRRARLKRWLAKIRPATIGLWHESLPGIPEDRPPEKSVDVFFAGQVEPSSTVRREGVAQLRALAARGYSIDIVEERLPYEEFVARLGRAWIAWSPEGFGWQCYRHYEAPLAWTVPLINQPRIVRSHPLEEGVHALHYTVEGDGLTRALETALADRPRLLRIAAAARAHVRAHHTFKALCARVIEETRAAFAAPPR